MTPSAATTDRFEAPGGTAEATPYVPPARVPWTTIALTLVEGLLFFGLLIPALLFGPPPGFVPPLLVFLGLRLVGDGARWVGRDRPVALGIEGHAKAASWGLLTLLVLVATTGGPPQGGGPPDGWIVAAALTLVGLSLYGHHRKALDASTRLGTEEAVLGATLAAVALPFALAPMIPAGAARTLTVGGLLAFGLAVAATLFVRLRRTAAHDGHVTKDGWSAFYHEHFFRHTLILVAVVAWFVLRDSLRGVLPLFVLFEYGAGITLLGTLFWSLRAFVRQRIVAHPLASPHTRHEQSVERLGEAGFDDLDAALGAYLDRGDTRPVAALAGFLEDRGIAAKRALEPITSDTHTETLLLVHPAWLYGARIGILVGIALALWRFTDGVVVAAGAEAAAWQDFLGLLVLGAGVWASQWNGFGGPWWARSATGLMGALFVALADLRLAVTVGGASFLVHEFGATAAVASYAVLFGVPAIHTLRGRRAAVHARYAGDTDEPLATIARIRADTERNLVRRIVWLSVIGVLVFVGVAELERVAPGAAFLFEVYLATAAAVVLHPVLLVAGLRMGRAQVARREARERRRRLERHRTAMGRLDDAIGALGDPAPRGAPATTTPGPPSRPDHAPASPHGAA